VNDKAPEENVYKAIMRSKVLGALEAARAVQGMTHPGLKGRVREILLGELFRPLLPADVSIASGQIVQCNSGRLSRQHDVILFDASILPPLAFDPSAAIIPIESVLYTIEVKSKLTKAELEKAHKSAKELSSFQYLTGPSGQTGQLVSVVFALESDIASAEFSEPKRYHHLYGEEVPYLKAICIAGGGYWYEHKGNWLRVGGELPGDDVLAFIGGVMNTSKEIAATRGPQKLGNYLIEKPKEMRILRTGPNPSLRQLQQLW
jgi:hypothetical protein